MTASPAGKDPKAAALPPRVGTLAWLVVAQAVAMLGYAGVTVVVAATETQPSWAAVGFVVVVLTLWGLGLLFVARRGLLRARRWAFSPVMFTQLMFGVIAVVDLRASSVPPLAVALWLLVLLSALAGLLLLFSPEVRHTLVPSPAPPRG